MVLDGGQASGIVSDVANWLTYIDQIGHVSFPDFLETPPLVFNIATLTRACEQLRDLKREINASKDQKAKLSLMGQKTKLEAQINNYGKE